MLTRLSAFAMLCAAASISANQLPVNSAPVGETVRLCETENPAFNPARECLKLAHRKYPGRNCTVKIGPTEFKPMGSCRDCSIECR
jgi:hypothetical protein